MWNTGCNNILNFLDAGLSIVNGENQSLSITVPPRGVTNWKSVIFPWCNYHQEVKDKAFRVINLKSGKMMLYLFQDYSTNKICWVLANKQDLYRDKSYVLQGAEVNSDQLPPYSAIDIYILPTHVFGAASQSQNTIAQDVFAALWEVYKVQVSAAGSIVGAL